MRRLSWIAALMLVLLMGSWALAQTPPAAGAPAPSAGKVVSYFDWFVLGADWIGLILIPLSVISMGVIIQQFLTIRHSVVMPEPVSQQISQMVQGKQYRELIAFTGSENTLVAFILRRALAEAPHGYAAMEQAMENALQERMSRLNLKPEVLSIMGNTGPLIGLLGTVMGIILAFIAIVKKGTMPDPSELASSIGVALVATFWGLMVAIPSLVTYAFMKNRIDAMTQDALAFGRECLSSFRAGGAKRESGSAAPAPATAAV